MAKNVTKRILKFNKGRDPEMVKLKWKMLKQNPFRFFRGTCHLFYEDLPKKSFVLKSPKTWICGDLHLENFGTYRGDNRVAYFDMNDFDEAILGPCLLDVTRLCTSIFLMPSLMKISAADCEVLAGIFLQSYTRNLSAGYIKAIEPETATGFIQKFLETMQTRKRVELLHEKTRLKGKHLTIHYDDIKTFKASVEEKAKVKKAIEAWAVKNTKDPGFYKVIDVVIRQVGTGSLGIERHLALVEGKGKPDGFYLLDVKQALPASPLMYLNLKQPKWKSEAERVISVQRRVQAEAPASLHPIRIGESSFVIKELQPIEDKIDFALLENDMHKLSLLMKDMGRIIAWNNLRSGGRQGSAIADELMRFGNKMPGIEKDILSYSKAYAQQTVKYWQEYVKASKA